MEQKNFVKSLPLVNNIEFYYKPLENIHFDFIYEQNDKNTGVFKRYYNNYFITHILAYLNFEDEEFSFKKIKKKDYEIDYPTIKVKDYIFSLSSQKLTAKQTKARKNIGNTDIGYHSGNSQVDLGYGFYDDNMGLVYNDSTEEWDEPSPSEEAIIFDNYYRQEQSARDYEDHQFMQKVYFKDWAKEISKNNSLEIDGELKNSQKEGYWFYKSFFESFVSDTVKKNSFYCKILYDKGEIKEKSIFLFRSDGKYQEYNLNKFDWDKLVEIQFSVGSEIKFDYTHQCDLNIKAFYYKLVELKYINPQSYNYDSDVKKGLLIDWNIKDGIWKFYKEYLPSDNDKTAAFKYKNEEARFEKGAVYNRKRFSHNK